MTALPQSTYRLQFHSKFTFRDAIAILPYLRELGISHVYASPYLKAVAGSTHGYDVIDHNRINDEIGSDQDYADFIAALRQSGLEQILDTVPNHMGIATNDNQWFNDVLANGLESQYADFFDIDWAAARNKILLPFLGEPYLIALAKNQLMLRHDADGLHLHYYDRRFPISPATSETDLDALLKQQHYRLEWWELASEEINYRRFFDINSLIALNQQREEVFQATHHFTFDLLADGRVAGLRIDHPDGLYNPKQYLQRLQQRFSPSPGTPGRNRLLPPSSGTPGEGWGGGSSASSRQNPHPNPLPDYRARGPEINGLYVVVEKILAMDESLPDDWPVHGTTGYDFLAMTNALFVDPSAEESFTRFYQEWTGTSSDFSEIVRDKKRMMLKTAFAPDFRRLASRLNRLDQKDALRELIVHFSVYRSYMSDGRMSAQDEKQIQAAIDSAAAEKPSLTGALNDLKEFLASDREFAARFQQLTPPVTAKGVEDTAYYNYNRLISLNEVGGDPARFGISPARLHEYFVHRRNHWPYSLSPLSTHDTKRSEDVRARINALTQIPDEWQSHVRQWSRINEPLRAKLGDARVPDRNEEYLIYQTLVGVWSNDNNLTERIQAYMLKAIREAKIHTNWLHPNVEYEQAMHEFITAVLDRAGNGDFFASFEPFQKRISDLGFVNSLAQTLLRLTAPGVPDTYQGTELLDFSLVDPDNRRPVDYPLRKQMLAELKSNNLPSTRDDGRIKMLLIWKVLNCRNERPKLFTEGEYIPVECSDRFFSFIRRAGSDVALVVIPRFSTSENAAMKLPDLPPLRHLFTSRPLTPENPLADFPVGLFVSW